MHDAALAYGPMLLILFGLLWNGVGLRDLKNDMNARFDKVDARQDRMQADLSRFYEILGEHTGKIEMLRQQKG